MSVQQSWREYKKVHPCADIFPPLPPNELEKLADDIAANGQQVPIRTKRVNGELFVIDGRNRLDAMELRGLQLVDDKGEWTHRVKVEFGGTATDGEIATEVVALNLRRRHLTTAERAEIAAKLANLPHGGDRRSDQGAKLPLEKKTTIKQAARLMKVSERSVKTAKQQLSQKPLVKPKPKIDTTGREYVVKKFQQFLDRWSVTQQRAVKAIIHEYTTK